MYRCIEPRRTHRTHVEFTADSGAARAEIVPQNSPLGTISVLSGRPRLFPKPHILYNDVLEWICFECRCSRRILVLLWNLLNRLFLFMVYLYGFLQNSINSFLLYSLRLIFSLLYVHTFTAKTCVNNIEVLLLQ